LNFIIKIIKKIIKNYLFYYFPFISKLIIFYLQLNKKSYRNIKIIYYYLLFSLFCFWFFYLLYFFFRFRWLYSNFNNRKKLLISLFLTLILILKKLNKFTLFELSIWNGFSLITLLSFKTFFFILIKILLLFLIKELTIKIN